MVNMKKWVILCVVCSLQLPSGSIADTAPTNETQPPTATSPVDETSMTPTTSTTDEAEDEDEDETSVTPMTTSTDGVETSASMAPITTSSERENMTNAATSPTSSTEQPTQRSSENPTTTSAIETTQTTSGMMTSTTPLPVPLTLGERILTRETYVYDGSLSLAGNYTAAMNNVTSAEFKAVADPINAVLSATVINGSTTTAFVKSLRSGSIIATFSLFITLNSPNSTHPSSLTVSAVQSVVTATVQSANGTANFVVLSYNVSLNESGRVQPAPLPDSAPSNVDYVKVQYSAVLNDTYIAFYANKASTEYQQKVSRLRTSFSYGFNQVKNYPALSLQITDLSDGSLVVAFTTFYRLDNNQEYTTDIMDIIGRFAMNLGLVDVISMRVLNIERKTMPPMGEAPLPPGAIAGIVILCVLVVLIAVVLICAALKKRRDRRSHYLSGYNERFQLSNRERGEEGPYQRTSQYPYDNAF